MDVEVADLDIALVSIIELLPSFVDIVKDPLQLGSGSIGSIVREAKNANFNGRPIESSAGYLNSTVRLDRSEIIVNRRLLMQGDLGTLDRLHDGRLDPVELWRVYDDLGIAVDR